MQEAGFNRTQKTVLFGVTGVGSSLLNILRSSNIFCSPCLHYRSLLICGFSSSSRRQSVSTDTVVGRLPVTLANQYFSLDWVGCTPSCASYTSRNINANPLRSCCRHFTVYLLVTCSQPVVTKRCF
jgi:hypothetical protein